jgi:hypothetical protein
MAIFLIQVNEQAWLAFEMPSFEALSHKEVTENLGMAQAAVRMFKSRILKKKKFRSEE